MYLTSSRKALYLYTSVLVMAQQSNQEVTYLELLPKGSIDKWENENVNLTCKGVSNNTIWFSLNGRDFGDDNAYRITVINRSVSVLTILSDRIKTTCEEKRYDCEQQIEDRIHISNRVNVTIHPLIHNVALSPMEDYMQGVIENSVTKFTCSTQCRCTELLMQWHVRNTTNILQITNQTRCQSYNSSTTSALLYMANRHNHGSHIKCSVSIKDKQTVYSKNYTLKVLYPPRVDIQKTNIDVWENKSFDVNCTVLDGNPGYTETTWTRGRDEIKWMSRRLNITSVRRTDDSTYTCTAWNTMRPSNGSVLKGTDNKAFIETFYVSNYDWTKPVTVSENENIEMVCKAEGNPLPNVTLLHQNDLLKKQDFSGNVSFTKSATCTDVSGYECQAMNVTNDASTKHICIYVLCKPRPNKKVEIDFNASSAINNDVTLSYTALAYPHPSFVWYRNGSSLITSEPRIHVSTLNLQTNLTITNVEESDFGKYFLNITNELGSTLEQFNLNPQEHVASIPDTSQHISEIVGGTLSGLFVLRGIVITLFVYRRRFMKHPERATVQSPIPDTYENLKIDQIPNEHLAYQMGTPNNRISETNVDHTYDGLSRADNGQDNEYTRLGDDSHNDPKPTYENLKIDI